MLEFISSVLAEQQMKKRLTSKNESLADSRFGIK